MDIKKIFFESNPIGRLFIKVVHAYHVRKGQKYHDGEVAKMRKYGEETLKSFDETMTELNIPYCLATGTLLGAVREKGFIPHDEDIDVFMWIEDFTESLFPMLEAHGFVHQHSYIIEDGSLGREDSFLYKGVQIDIFYVCPPIDGFPYFTDYFEFDDCKDRKESIRKHGGELMPRRLNTPIIKEFIRVPFENLSLPIPINANEVLQFRYGDDYMIPNTKWMAGQYNPNVIPWPEKSANIVK